MLARRMVGVWRHWGTVGRGEAPAARLTRDAVLLVALIGALILGPMLLAVAWGFLER